jgi:uncharacterized protein YbaR (Trm112 family)
MRNSSDNWQIDHQCPQCGAHVTLDETDHLLLCPYCRTKLYLFADNHFIYYIPAPEAISRDVIYMPYWRMKGFIFSVLTQEVTSRFFDTNLLALDVKGIPISLGLRPQVFKLRFASPDIGGRFLDPGISAQTVMQRLNVGSPAAFYQAFIGEMVSLIYSPMYLKNDVIYDAILKRPLCRLKTEDVSGILASSDLRNLQFRFLQTLCPECGWDTQGERNAQILICRNCDSAWTFQATGAKKVPFSIMTYTGIDTAVTCYLPFWRMKARIEGIVLNSYADMIRVGNLPKAITADFERMPFNFWSPAFKINPALFLRWSKQMTVYQPEGKSTGAFPEVSIHPVTLPISEAQESIIVTLASLINDKRRLFPVLSQIRITLDEFLLVYHPFFISRNELVHAKIGLTIDRNALEFGMQL